VRLAQFDDRDKFASLIALPDVLMDEVEDARRRGDGWATRASARQARAAVAIEILNTLPVRRGSLVSIDVKRNIIPNRGMWPLLIFYPDQVEDAPGSRSAPQSADLASHLNLLQALSADAARRRRVDTTVPRRR